MMQPGTYVRLPDGREGYYQGKTPEGHVTLLQLVTIPAAAAKGMKEVK